MTDRLFQIFCSRSLRQYRINHKFHVSVRLLTIKISQSAREDFCSYCKNKDGQYLWQLFFQTKDPFIIITTITAERRRVFQITVKDEKLFWKIHHSIILNLLWNTADQFHCSFWIKIPATRFAMILHLPRAPLVQYIFWRTNRRCCWHQAQSDLPLFAGICPQNLDNKDL